MSRCRHPAPMDPEAKLEELGIELPEVSKPVASYVPAVTTDSNLCYVSGQLPFIDGELPSTGRVGGGIDPKEAHELARLCGINILAAVKHKVGQLRHVRRVVRIEGFVASADSFTDQPKVINGCSDLLGQVFGEAGKHSRFAVGVNVLPLNSPVEIGAIFEIEASKI